MRMRRGMQMGIRNTEIVMELGHLLMGPAPSEETSSTASTMAATLLMRRPGRP